MVAYVNDFSFMLTTDVGMSCKAAIKADITGDTCAGGTVPLWQHSSMHLHVDYSSSSAGCTCSSWASGYSNSEDAFGFYHSTFTGFSCSASSTSTTEWWYGACVDGGSCDSYDPPRSCVDIANNNNGASDGTYHLDLDGDGIPDTYGSCDFDGDLAWTLIESSTMANLANTGGVLDYGFNYNHAVGRMGRCGALVRSLFSLHDGGRNVISGIAFAATVFGARIPSFCRFSFIFLFVLLSVVK